MVCDKPDWQGRNILCEVLFSFMRFTHNVAFSETYLTREEIKYYLCSKWLSINEDLAYKKILILLLQLMQIKSKLVR